MVTERDDSERGAGRGRVLAGGGAPGTGGGGSPGAGRAAPVGAAVAVASGPLPGVDRCRGSVPSVVTAPVGGD